MWPALESQFQVALRVTQFSVQISSWTLRQGQSGVAERSDADDWLRRRCLREISDPVFQETKSANETKHAHWKTTILSFERQVNLRVKCWKFIAATCRLRVNWKVQTWDFERSTLFDGKVFSVKLSFQVLDCWWIRTSLVTRVSFYPDWFVFSSSVQPIVVNNDTWVHEKC